MTLPSDAPSADAEIERLRLLLAEKEAELRDLRLSLEVLTTVDTVTGLMNRNGVVDALETQLRWLRRKVQPFAVVRVVPAGDLGGDEHEFFRHVAALLAGSLRAVDLVGLTDGEFTAILPETAAGAIPTVLRRMTRTFGSLSESFPDVEMRYAVVTCRVSPDRTVTDILAALDQMEPSRDNPPILEL